MTLKYEEVRAQELVEMFLKDLMDPRKTPRVPKVIREEARRRLRHLASPSCVERGSLNGN